VRAHRLFLSTVALAVISGCNSSSTPSPAAQAKQREQLDEVRQELTQIPLPTKSRYLAVKSLTTWQNPYLTVQDNMVTLHVTVADANPSELGVGGMLRPVGARQQSLNVRTSDLPAAINAIPQNSWPYGRVVAVEEAHDAPAAARPQLRRNMEAAMKTLNDIGVIVYEWQENGQGIR
jgi:hypothetical protein